VSSAGPAEGAGLFPEDAARALKRSLIFPFSLADLWCLLRLCTCTQHKKHIRTA